MIWKLTKIFLLFSFEAFIQGHLLPLVPTCSGTRSPRRLVVYSHGASVFSAIATPQISSQKVCWPSPLYPKWIWSSPLYLNWNWFDFKFEQFCEKNVPIIFLNLSVFLYCADIFHLSFPLPAYRFCFWYLSCPSQGGDGCRRSQAELG